MKQSEIKETATEDLKDRLLETRKTLSELKMAHTITPLENPIQLRAHRKTIARIMTELTKRDVQ